MALIYVVEDDKNIQEIETFALANVGYEVKGFDSATDFYAAWIWERMIILRNPSVSWN